MAKKFAAVEGLHELFDIDDSSSYILTSFLPTVTGIDHNTVCFVTADAMDEGYMIGNHKIKLNDRYIIVQKDVFSLYGSLEIEPEVTEQSWRPIYINGESVLQTENPMNLDFADSDYLKPVYETDYSTESLKLKYDIDLDNLYAYILARFTGGTGSTGGTGGTGETGSFNIGDGTLYVYPGRTSVHTDKGSSRDIEIPQNTLEISSTTTNDEGETEETNFTANTDKDTSITIRYKGTADRSDWYVDQDQRDENSDNESTAKKFVYIEPLQEYFEPSQFPNISSVKEDKKGLISEDSIVFITCGQSMQTSSAGVNILTDAQVFNNPEYQPGARFIWTHNRMFSSNTWMPLATRENKNSAMMEANPIVGSETRLKGGKLIFEGAGGIKVTNHIDGTDVIISIDGSEVKGTSGGGTSGGTCSECVYTPYDDEAKTIALGGIAENTLASMLKGKTMSQMFDELLFPTYIPKYTDASVSSVIDPSTSLFEIGSSVPSITISSTVCSAKIGETYVYGGTGVDSVTSSPTDFNTVGTKTWSYKSDFPEGTEAVLDNKGNNCPYTASDEKTLRSTAEALPSEYNTHTIEKLLEPNNAVYVLAGVTKTGSRNVTVVYPYYIPTSTGWEKVALTNASNFIVTNFSAKNLNTKMGVKLPASFKNVGIIPKNVAGTFANADAKTIANGELTLVKTENESINGLNVSYSEYRMTETNLPGANDYKIIFTKA